MVNKFKLENLKLFRQMLSKELGIILNKIDSVGGAVNNVYRYNPFVMSRMGRDTIEEIIDFKKLPTECELIKICKYFKISLFRLCSKQEAEAIAFDYESKFFRLSEQILDWTKNNNYSNKDAEKNSGIPSTTINYFQNYRYNKISPDGVMINSEKLHRADSRYTLITFNELDYVFANVNNISIISSSMSQTDKEIINNSFKALNDIILVNKSIVPTNVKKTINDINNTSFDINHKFDFDGDEVTSIPIDKEKTEQEKQQKKMAVIAKNFKKLRKLTKKTNSIGITAQQDNTVEEKEKLLLTEYEIGFRDGYFQCLKEHGLMNGRVK